MTKNTTTWGISYPEGKQKVAVPADVQGTAATTDAALSQNKSAWEQAIAASETKTGDAITALADGITETVVNQHLNPGGEYENIASAGRILAQGETTVERSTEWANTGSYSWKGTHTSTAAGFGSPSAFFGAGGSIPLNGATEAAASITVRNGAAATRDINVRLYAADTQTGGSTVTDGTALGNQVLTLAPGQAGTVTLMASNIDVTRPTAQFLRLQFWRQASNGAAAGDVVFADDVFIGVGSTAVPDTPFDGDQTSAFWTGEPGNSASQGFIPLDSSGGGGGSVQVDGHLWVETDGDDKNSGAPGKPLATLGAAFSRAKGMGGCVIHLGPGTFPSTPTPMPSYTQLIGSGRGKTIIRLPNETELPILTVSMEDVLNTDTYQSGSIYVTETVIRDLTLDGNRANQSWPVGTGEERQWSDADYQGRGGLRTGLYINKPRRWILDNIEIKDANGIGYFSTGQRKEQSRWGALNNLYVHGCALGGGRSANASRDTHFSKIYTYENDTFGWMVDASESTYTGIYARQNGDVGIWVRNVFACNLEGFSAHGNGGHGIRVTALHDSSGASWSAHNNGRAGTGGHADVRLDGIADWDSEGLGATYGPNSNIAIEGISAGGAGLDFATDGAPWFNNADRMMPLLADYALQIGPDQGGNIHLGGITLTTENLGEFLDEDTGFETREFPAGQIREAAKA